jgi:coatomer protein complex subunit alpha (xenin)
MFQVSGQKSLSYVTHYVHKLNIEDNSQNYCTDNQYINIGKEAIYLCPPIPIFQTDNNWPLLTISKGFFDCTILPKNKNSISASLVPQENNINIEGWDSEEDENNVKDDIKNREFDNKIINTPNESAGWDVEDVDIPIELQTNSILKSNETYFSPPLNGISISQNWKNNSQLAIDHILAGSYNTAFRLLYEQIGILKFDKYKLLFMNTYLCSRISMTLFSNIPSFYYFPVRNWKEMSIKSYLPAIILHISDLIYQLQISYQLTTSGKFNEAIEKLQNILHTVPLLVVNTKQDIAEAQQLVEICKEYILGLKMETERKQLQKTSLSQQKRICEMVAYFTHCNLQPIHQILTLRTAVNTFFKFKNYKTTRSFARRLLELGPKPEVAQQVRKILQVRRVY